MRAAVLLPALSLLLLLSPSLRAAPQSPVVFSRVPEGPLSLEQAYDLALGSDQTIRIAFLEVQKANLLPLGALTRVAPRLHGSYSYDRTSSSAQLAALNAPLRSRGGSGMWNLSLDQPLFDLSVFPAQRRGKLLQKSTQFARNFTIRETLFGVASAYYEVLKQERLLKVNQQSLELASQQQMLAQTRADVGEVTRSDVLRAQVSVETARRALIASENTLEFQRNTLRNILNVPPDAPLRLVEPSPYPCSSQAFEQLLSTAWQKREDLLGRILAVQASEERRREIQAQYAPKLVASADQSISQNSGPNAGHREQWMAGVSVQIPFFEGGQREIDLANSRRDVDQAVLDKERLGKSIEAEVKRAWLNVRALDSSLRAVQAQVQAAEQSYSDLQNQYRAGIAKSVDVLSALTDLNTARSDLAAMTLDYQVALRSLERVTGTFQEARVRKSVPSR
ncbi:MAG: hypothetical protein RLZZ244_1070 [Verrucomicrobiota bacterium]